MLRSCSNNPQTHSTLILPRSRLARLELIQVPPADGKASLVLVHALAEVIDVGRADAALGRGVDLLVLLGEVVVLGRGLGGRGGGAAGEPAADGVADRGADCYTAVTVLALHVASTKVLMPATEMKRICGLTRRCWPSGRTARGPGWLEELQLVEELEPGLGAGGRRWTSGGRVRVLVLRAWQGRPSGGGGQILNVDEAYWRGYVVRWWCRGRGDVIGMLRRWERVLEA